MVFPKILPDIGNSVSTTLLNTEASATATFGEIMYAATTLLALASQRLSDPATYHQLATYRDATGTDWSGLQGDRLPANASPAGVTSTATLERTDRNLNEEVQSPIEPDNYCDTLPAMGQMLSQASRFHDNMMTQFSRYVESSMSDQRAYLGTPRNTRDFRDVADYLTSTMRISRNEARKIIRRGAYFAHRPGPSSNEPAAQPKFEELAASLANGDLPVENADKLIEFDRDLTRYSNKTNQPVKRKDEVMQIFEPTMVETGESCTPDELHNIKRRWMDHVTHWISPDGPPPSQAFGKQADNALKVREQADGSAIYSMHASQDVSTRFKYWMYQQLDFDGSPAEVSDDALRLLDLFDLPTQHVEEDVETTTEEPVPPEDPPDPATRTAEAERTVAALGPVNDWNTTPDPLAVVAETADGTTITASEMQLTEHLTAGQKLGSILLSQFLTMLSMDPTELGGKKAHGISAQLIIVQDIQTAYQHLGKDPLPEEHRRPPGPAGFIPPVIKRPNPDDPTTPLCLDHPYDYSQQPRDPESSQTTRKRATWTPYQSEAVNIGPIHPQDVEPMLCNATLTGHIWDGPDEVLKQHRAQRLFTAAQRRAILARDRGCQAPGCTTPAVWCDVHHIHEWSNGGPTNEDNGIVLCPAHHQATHAGRWIIRKHEGRTFFQPARWIDPYQPLLRNAYWNTT